MGGGPGGPGPRGMGPPGGQQQQQQQMQRGGGRKKVQRGLEDNVRRTVYISYIDQQVCVCLRVLGREGGRVHVSASHDAACTAHCCMLAGADMYTCSRACMHACTCVSGAHACGASKARGAA